MQRSQESIVQITSSAAQLAQQTPTKTKVTDTAWIVSELEKSKLIMAESTYISQEHSLGQEGEKNLFFGTGLVSTRGLSVGLPFDFVMYLIVAAIVRAKLGLSKIIHLIADTHALGTQSADGFEAEVRRSAEEQARLFKNLAASVGLADVYQVQLASSIREDPYFQQVLAGLEHIPDQYVRNQAADVHYFHTRHQAAVKLSWHMPSKKVGKDERYFDQLYREKANSTSMSFIYCPPGRTFQSDRQNVCPYSSIEGEERILMKAGAVIPDFEAFTSKDKHKLATKAHLQEIVNGFESTFLNLQGTTLKEKIIEIIDMSLQPREFSGVPKA